MASQSAGADVWLCRWCLTAHVATVAELEPAPLWRVGDAVRLPCDRCRQRALVPYYTSPFTLLSHPWSPVRFDVRHPGARHER